ncbi:MAG TPA: C40 family peptidase [Herpetosiphonaceae bacterium]|nr:C40 family peptidase [Herpetosiphonaceae bacterium]
MIVSPADLVHGLRRELFADRRSTHANLTVEQRAEVVSISGTVLDRGAAEALLGTLNKRAPTVNWRDETTPLVAGPDYSWALNTRAVVDVRHEPSHKTERITQIVYGERLEILRLVDNWAFVRLQDGYLGWAQIDSLQICTAEAATEWISSATHLVRQPLLPCYATSNGEPHQQVMLLPFGARLHVIGADGPYRRVRCPDGVTRWVPVTGLLPLGEPAHSGIEGLHTVVSWAHALIGVPYLWGGKTPFGYDCSGLVQTCFNMIGIHLRRDADQQFTEGQAVDFDEVEFGDCLFFDTSVPEEALHGGHELKVTHVGLALDGQEFLHASRTHGGVVRGSFDAHSPLFVRGARLRFLGARRYV